MFYKTPGPHLIDGGRYEYIVIDEAVEGAVAQAHAQGWADTPSQASAQTAAPAPVVQDEKQADVSDDETRAPSRAEMEEKAAQIGLKIDRRWSDATLLAKLTEALG